MSETIGFILLAIGIVLVIVLHSFLETLAEFRDAKEREIKKDIEEFGHCCGLETGQCTYQPKIDKLNKADKHHKTTASVKNKEET
jgi:hypothetical protein